MTTIESDVEYELTEDEIQERADRLENKVRETEETIKALWKLRNRSKTAREALPSIIRLLRIVREDYSWWRQQCF